MASSAGEPSEIFRNACTTFRSKLSDEEKRLFQESPNAETMLDAIKQQAKDHPIHSSRLTACCEKISSLAVKLSPFFEVVNIFVSTNPEYMGIGWGAIRLVFQLGMNYVSFLEKLCDMFLNMGLLLPAYEEYIQELQRRAQKAQREVSSRLLKALSYIYSDLIQFCFDACKLFSKKVSTLRLKGSFINSILWKPFDVRFDTLLTRFKEHKELIDMEMKVASHTEAMEISSKFDDMVQRVEHQWEEKNEHAREMDREEMENRLYRLKEWINPPTWLELFENAQSRQTPGTAEWFLMDSTLKCWLNRTSQDIPFNQINALSIQGKPGYGKTTLCTTLIEYLRRNQARRPRLNSVDGSSKIDIAFFYFDKQRQDSTGSGDAFRAILTQLLQIYGNNKKTIDIASILWDTRMGQLTASNSEIRSVIRLLLQQVTHLIMVFDGIDECIDQYEFFERLEEIRTTNQNCSVALFSRPTVQLPRRLIADAFFIDLRTAQNLEDICSFLRPKIRELANDQVLSSNTEIEATVSKISGRANGMFLWARLFIEYLQFPALTVRQRSDAIDNLNRLEGLDALYNAILLSLMEKSPKQARMNMRLAFQLVAWSYRPLHVDEFSCAISIPLDRKVEPDDFIPNIERSLSALSGALMEVNSDMTIRFIHLSVLEYLTASSQYQETDANHEAHFSIDTDLANRYCASLCLSYLVYSIPSEPLGGSAQTTPDKQFQRTRYPFLEYASEYWSRHVLESVKSLISRNEIETDGSIDILFNLASTFLANPRRIALWIEASWMFNHAPQIGSGFEDEVLSIDFEILCCPNLNQRARLMKVLGVLRHLANDLASLNKSWAGVLRATPNEIWEPSVSTFTKSEYWITVGGAKLIPLASRRNIHDKFICVKSQVSISGLEMGLIKVWPPELPQATVNGTNINLIQDWNVGYELWSITSTSIISRISFSLPMAAMAPFIRFETDDSVDDPRVCDKDHGFSFQFPTAISSDLRRAAVLCFVAKAFEPTNENNSRSSSSKSSEAQQALYEQIDLSLTSMTGNTSHFQFDWHKFDEGYTLQMSNSGEFLLVMHVSSGPIEISHNHSIALWFLRIYRDLNFQSSRSSNYVCTASIAFKPPKCFYDKKPSTQDIESSIAFHPYTSLLAFTHGGSVITEQPWKRHPSHRIVSENHMDGGTSLWDFSSKGITPFKLSEGPITNLRFSNDGNQLYGDRARDWLSQSDRDLVSLRIPPRHKMFPSARHGQQSLMSYTSCDRAPTRNSVQTLRSLSDGPAPMTQQSNSLIFGRDQQGLVNISELRQDADNGALVLHAVREDGKVSSATLSRLPEWVAREYQAALLKPFGGGDPDKVNIVLNRSAKPFQFYHSDESSEPFLPILLERDQSTINAVVGRAQDGGDFYRHINRKRIGWDDDEHRKRPRTS